MKRAPEPKTDLTGPEAPLRAYVLIQTEVGKASSLAT